MSYQMWLKHGQIDPLLLQEFEMKIGHQLPTAYRNFLLETNGGIPENSIFEVPDYTSSSILFFGLGVDIPSNDLRYAVRVFADAISDGFLPIGRDPGGNLVLMDVKGGKENKIVFWNHGSNDGELGGKFAEMFIASTFSDFIDSLQPESE